MSEINKMLNELSRKSAGNAAAAPLQAAAIRPVPKSQTLRWVAMGVSVAVLAGGAGWWFGSSQAGAQSEFSQQSQISAAMAPESKASVSQVAAEPKAVPEQAVATVVASVIPESQVESKPTPVELKNKPEINEKAEAKPEAVKAPAVEAAKPAASVKPKVVVAAPSLSKSQVEPKTEIKPVSQQKTPILKTAVEEKPQPKPSVTAKPAQRESEKEPQEKAEQETLAAEGLRIETVELDAKQLARVEFNKAKKAWEAGNSRKAIGYLESALTYLPEWVKARQKLSALYYGRGETRKALSALQQGLAIDSEQPELRLTLAKLLANESQPQAALNILSPLPVQNHIGYLAMRGALAQQFNNNEMAMSSYQRLVKVEPYDGRWWMGLGIALERNKQAGKARDAYQQALLMGQISLQSQQFIQQRLAVLEAREG